MTNDTSYLASPAFQKALAKANGRARGRLTQAQRRLDSARASQESPQRIAELEAALAYAKLCAGQL